MIANVASTVAIGIGAIALTVQGMRMTSDFNAWQRAAAVKQVADQSKGEAALATERLQDRCIAIAKFATEVAERSRPEDVPTVLKAVGALDKECSSVGPAATAIAAAIVVRTARRFDDKTVARAAMIVEAVGRQPSRQPASAGATQSFDPKESLSYADSIISDAVGGNVTFRGFDARPPETASSDATESVTGDSRIAEALALRPAGGLSTLWDSPIGRIRFDMSRVLKAEPYDRTETFEFSTSTRF